MRTFKLMREAHETPDAISRALANAVGRNEYGNKNDYTIERGPDPSVMLRFWEMKQAGELTKEEAAAVWMVLMRHVEVKSAVRALLEHCFAGPARYPPTKALAEVCTRYLNALGDELRMPFISKLGTALCEALRNAAALRDETDAHCLDPYDCWTFLQACEVSLSLGEQEKKRVRELLSAGS